MENKVININGTLQKIVHKYEDYKFVNSFITIDEKGNIKKGIINGFVPGDFLGQFVHLTHTYAPKQETLPPFGDSITNQKLTYSEGKPSDASKKREFSIETKVSGLEDEGDFE